MKAISFPLSAILLLYACSGSDQVVNSSSPAPKRISSSITLSEPVAATNNLAEQRNTETTDTPEPEVPEVEPFVVSGTVRNETAADLTGTKVVLFWGVENDMGDHNFAFGEGTIDVENLTFEVQLPLPPDGAINRGILGVAYILVAKPSYDLTEGERITEDFEYTEHILGGAPRYCVIYTADGEDWTAWGVPWADDFEPGYSIGRGIEIPDLSHEGFEPVDPSTVEIVIDDLENLEFVNWS